MKIKGSIGKSRFTYWTDENLKILAEQIVGKPVKTNFGETIGKVISAKVVDGKIIYEADLEVEEIDSV